MEISHFDHRDDPDTSVTTAVLLAAGRGSRLQPLTDDAPKCLTEVDGIPILERQVRCLHPLGIKRLAREEVREPFLLLECDLVFEPFLLRNMILPDKMAVARVQPWMMGSTVGLDHFRKITDSQNRVSPIASLGADRALQREKTDKNNQGEQHGRS